VVATRVSMVVLGVFAFLTLTFLALTIGWFSYSEPGFDANSSGWIHLGGWLGIVTALVAWYGSLAGVMNATAKRVVFPTLPR